MSLRKASNVKSWFMMNDMRFGVSLLRMASDMERGKAMQDRYGIDLTGLDPGDEQGLLDKLNSIPSADWE
jgi:hypothetical protein